MIELQVVGSDRPAVVDDDFAHLSRYRWRIFKDGYVARKCSGKRIYLHHVVLPGDRYPLFLRDHKNRDRLDNQRHNLRWLTFAESAQNKGAQQRNTTGFRGVTVFGNRYRAVGVLNRKRHYLGYFNSIAEANDAVVAWRLREMPCTIEAA